MTPKTGARSSEPSSSTGNGRSSASSALPTASTSSQTSLSVRHARSASVSPRNDASAFGEPNRSDAPPTSSTPGRRLDDPPRLGVDASRARRAPSRTASRRDPRRARPRATTARRPRRGSGQPATAAFCTSSNERRPLTQSTCDASGSSALEERPADDLVHRVVASDVLAHARELAVGVEEPGRMQPAGRRERALRLEQPRRQRRDDVERDLERALDPRRARPRPPRSRPSRRRRTTTRCRSAAGAARGRSRPPRPRPCSPRDRPGARAEIGREPLREAEPERELLVVPRRPHRDGDRLAADADLERLLDRDDVALASSRREPQRVDAARRVRRRLGSPLTRSAYSWGEPRLSPRVARRQLAVAQTANTVSDQVARGRGHLAPDRPVDVVVVGERRLDRDARRRRGIRAVEPRAAAEEPLPGRTCHLRRSSGSPS